MKRILQLSVVGVLTLALAATAVAQQVPTPVTRIGDWVEISNDVFLNIIASTDWRYQFNENTDFEKDIRDRVASRQSLSTTTHNGTGDLLFQESRVGVDFRYRKHLTMQVLFEMESTIDGNRIDNGVDLNGDPPATQTFDDGRNLSCSFEGGGGCDQRNTVNLERAWIRYNFPDTPLTFEVGASLWTTDPAGVLGDDDPRFAVFLDLGPLQLSAAAVVQTESLRVGLTNDNDDIYYTFGVAYDLKPFTFGLDVAYFRSRFSGADGGGNDGQEHDTVLIQPSVTGSVGPVSFIAQPMLVWGEAEGTTAGGGRNFDVFGYGFIGQVELNLGVVRPFIAVVFGSGDDDPDDRDLDAFSPKPEGEITLTTGSRYFGVFDIAPSWGGRDVFPPAVVNLGTGFEFMHTVGNPWSDRVSPVADLDTTYANPGILLFAPGVQIFPFKGHEVDVYYIYRRVIETASLEALLLANEGVDVNVDESMSHEIGFLYEWAPNPHFDFRVMGAMVIPTDGIEDIASAQDCDADTAGLQACDGDTIALYGQLRFRARF
jgi:hypothetical protein